MENLLSLLKQKLLENPEKEAIIEKNRTITYSSLNALSNSYFKKLEAADIQPGEVIGIELDRSIEAIAAMIGILKIGAAYTVINKDYPESRKQLMVDTLKIRMVIDENDLPDDTDGSVWLAKHERKEESLCYVIFTSGTTSEPKAVGIPDRAVIRLIHEERLGLSPEKTISHISPLEFDASILEIWGGLLHGMTISLLTKTEILSIYSVEERINQGIDIMWVTCSLFNFWVDKKPEIFKSLSHVIVGGEQLSLSHVKEALNYTKVINGYGPTENTVFTTLDVMKNDVAEICIGTGIYGTETYIVDEQGQENSEGELYVGGAGLALGYLNNEEKTAEVFVEWQGKTIYKTGDLVKRAEDGRLIYIGRKDTQVKVNGYRIDLQEIEANVKSLGIKNCHAFVKERKIYLAVTTQHPRLLEELRQRLPIYMLPAKINWVPELPLTANGKTDTVKLYEQYFLSTPEKVIRILEKYCTGKKIDLATSIFELEVDSVIIWELVREINDQFNVNLSFFDVIENAVVSELVNLLGGEYLAAYNL